MYYFLWFWAYLHRFPALYNMTEITHVATFSWEFSLPPIIPLIVEESSPSFFITQHLTSKRECSTPVHKHSTSLCLDMLANRPLARANHMAKVNVNKQQDFTEHKNWEAWSLGSTNVAMYPIQSPIQGKVTLKYIDYPWTLIKWNLLPSKTYHFNLRQYLLESASSASNFHSLILFLLSWENRKKTGFLSLLKYNI